MKKYCFGVDVGGTTVKIGLLTTDGELLDKWEIPTDRREDGGHILTDIAGAIEKKLTEKDLSKDEVEGVGIGVPGAVLPDGTVNRCVNLGWGVKKVGDELGAILSLPVRVGNDANVAALGEMWQGGAKGHQDVLMVTLGTGVGGGLIIGGKIITGFHGAGAEIGHIVVNKDETESCNCGNHGCLEQYASATGIVRMTKKLLEKETADSVLRKEEITAKAIFDAAKQGDALAKKAVEDYCETLGFGLAAACNTVNPEIVVIGGGVSNAGQALVDAAHSAFQKYAFHALRDTEFTLATLGNDAGMYGSARLILDA